MKNILTVFILAYFLNYSCCRKSREVLSSSAKGLSSSEVQAKSAKGVVERLLPDSADLFEISIDFGLGPKEKSTFKITKTSEDEKVEITASSGVAATRGFYHYLNEYCGCHVSWDGVQISLPEILPDANITVTSRERYRYFQNVCTFSYSYSWWSWKQWRAHLDWLALQGVNLVLAPAQESVWARTWHRLGLNQTNSVNVLAGPPFLAWQRMGNIGRWGGPPSIEWLSKQQKLQKKILRNLHELGVWVALPTFAGHIPRAIKRIHPNSNTSLLPPWNGFSYQYAPGYFLDPSDPLFDRISRIFHEELENAYNPIGFSGIYFADPFNEIVPSGGKDYVGNVARNLYQILIRRDPKAVWLLQAWMFVHDLYWTDERIKSFLTAVPHGRLLILDLQAEQNPQFNRTNYFHGHNFIWCALHNFGGTLGLFGQTVGVNEGISEARVSVSSGSKLTGIGGTPEGINQNYVLYELIYSLAWLDTDRSIDLENWIQNYATRRYGKSNDFAIEAWSILFKTVYDYQGKERMRGKYTYNRRPSLRIRPWYWYNGSEVNKAWHCLLNASDDLAGSDLFQHDLVDVTRQALQQIADQLYIRTISAYRRNKPGALNKIKIKFLDLLDDIDEILATNKHFLLSQWLEDAKASATSAQEKIRFEYNARNQITLWGPNGEIVDYANKQWSGVVSDFFKPRWTIFFDELITAVRKNVTLDESKVQTRIFKEAEEPFTFSTKIYPSQPKGDAIAVSKQLFDKWFDYSQTLPEIPRTRRSKSKVTA